MRFRFLDWNNKNKLYSSSYIPFLIWLCGACTLTGCTYNELPSDFETPDNISFEKNILPLFNADCSTSGCHSGSRPEAGISLEPIVAYEQLLINNLIDTTNPESSILYVQITIATDIMPPNNKLDSYKQQLIYKWIEQGAKNN